VSEYVAPGEVARVLGVSRRAVTQWCAEGSISGAVKTPGIRGRWRIPVAFLSAFREGREAKPNAA